MLCALLAKGLAGLVLDGYLRDAGVIAAYTGCCAANCPTARVGSMT